MEDFFKIVILEITNMIDSKLSTIIHWHRPNSLKVYLLLFVKVYSVILRSVLQKEYLYYNN